MWIYVCMCVQKKCLRSGIDIKMLYKKACMICSCQVWDNLSISICNNRGYNLLKKVRFMSLYSTE